MRSFDYVRSLLRCLHKTARRSEAGVASCGMAASDIAVHRVALAAAALIALLVLIGSRAGFSPLRPRLISSAGAWHAAGWRWLLRHMQAPVGLARKCVSGPYNATPTRSWSRNPRSMQK